MCLGVSTRNEVNSNSKKKAGTSWPIFFSSSRREIGRGDDERILQKDKKK